MRVLILLLLFTSCCHSKKICERIDSDRFLVILVDAPHLDYSDCRRLLKSVVKHPRNGCKNGDVGHAWIYLHGEGLCLEGGHSGELGVVQPKYFDGVMDRIDRGDPNPAKYLWAIQRDGFFQHGTGGHRATYAVKVDITTEQCREILKFIESYPFPEYAIAGNQCSTFVAQVAALAGLELECEVTIPIDQQIRIGKCTYTLWTDPKYSSLTISSPDILEKSLQQAVEEGKVEYFPVRYVPRPKKGLSNLCISIKRFPGRYRRLQLLR